MNKIINYLKETKAEMRHVNWPTRKQTLYFTILIIAIAVSTSFFLGFFDFIFSWFLDTFVI